jgi:hypothetical protein
MVHEFCEVLARVWQVQSQVHEHDQKLRPLVMGFAALANVWNRFDFSNISAVYCQVPDLLLYSGLIFTTTKEAWEPEVSQAFRDIVLPQFISALRHAAENTKTAAVNQALGNRHGLEDVVKEVAHILEVKIANKITTALQQRWLQAKSGEVMQNEVASDVQALRKLLYTASQATMSRVQSLSSE